MKRTVGSVLAACLFTMLSMGIASGQAVSTAVIITSPSEGSSITNTKAQISGIAPPGAIVRVSITDTDTDRAGIAHQENGKVEGTVTAGSDGSWVYVPQHMLVPGQFSAQATFTSDQNQVINSPAVNFVVLNAFGASVQPSSSPVRQFVVGGGLLVALTLSLIILTANHRRRMDLKRIEENADEIEHELKVTANQLATTNAQIAKLNNRLSDEHKTTTSATRHKDST